MLRTQVVIIGGGPAGLLLSQLLHRAGIDTVLLERHTREYVLNRIRAGVLEWGTVEVLRGAGVGAAMDAEGLVHDGARIAWAGHGNVFLDTWHQAGKRMMAYGQTRITEDLYRARDAMGGVVIHEAEEVQPAALDSDAPFVSYRLHGQAKRIDCEFVAGCDGSHGVSRGAIPAAALREYHKEYPFGWLGVMSETPPLPDITYANSERGFALASMRNPMLSRYYIQCDLDTNLQEWPDERFWRELKARFPAELAASIVTGPTIEKSIAPLRSYVAEPMRWGRLLLAGDAAHIVPPTGAKGLNLAVSDVHYLSRALIGYYRDRDAHYLDCYSDMALRRVWGAVRLSWRLTSLLHRFPNQSPFDQRMQESELDYVTHSESAMRSLAEQYAGLPFED